MIGPAHFNINAALQHACSAYSVNEQYSSTGSRKLCTRIGASVNIVAIG